MLEIESKLRSESLEQANRHTCKLLLNCYIRELAQEREDDIALNADTLDYAVAFPVCGVTVLESWPIIPPPESMNTRAFGGPAQTERMVMWNTGN